MILRSPKAAALRGMADVEGYDNLDFLSTDEYKYVFLLMNQAGKGLDPATRYGMNGMMQRLFPDADKAISHLLDLGYAEKEHSKLTPTHNGFIMIKSLYNERENAEKETFILISQGYFHQAAAVVCRYNKRMPYHTSIGIDWNHLNPADRYFSEKQNAINHLTMDEISGHRTAVGLLWDGELLSFELSDEEKSEMRYWSSVASTERDIAGYKEAGILKYRVLTANRDDTCEICKKASGQMHLVFNAVIGKNCPPFHKGCRCTTVAYFDK